MVSDMSEFGTYRMARNWQDNAVFLGDLFSRRDAWVWLIEDAAFADRKVNIAGKTVTLHRGQLSHSTRFLAKAWLWSEAAVRRYLTRLKTDAMIDAVSDAGQTIITICNYGKYQVTPGKADAASDAVSDAEVTQERRRSDADYKEIKEIKKKESPLVPLSPKTDADASAAPKDFSLTSTAPAAKSPRQKRQPSSKTTIPDDFPDAAALERAVIAGVDRGAVAFKAQRFRNYWSENAGKKVNWQTTWNNWYLKDLEEGNNWVSGKSSGSKTVEYACQAMGWRND
jgi:hypothetical protein